MERKLSDILIYSGKDIVGYISISSHGYSLFATLSIDYREHIEGKINITYDPATFFSFYVKENMSSEEVWKEFNNLLLVSMQERLIGKRVDLEAWNNISKLIDWHCFFYPG